jgi:hypothetical protein
MRSSTARTLASAWSRSSGRLRVQMTTISLVPVMATSLG